MPGISEPLGFMLDPFADLTGLGRREVQEAYGPELASFLIQVPMGLALTRTGDAIGSLLIGVGGLAWAALNNRASERSRVDAMELSAHFLNRALITRPEDLAQVMTESALLKQGVFNGNAQAVRSALVRTPEEITGLVRTVQMQSAQFFGTLMSPGGYQDRSAQAQWQPPVPHMRAAAQAAGNGGNGGTTSTRAIRGADTVPVIF